MLKVLVDYVLRIAIFLSWRLLQQGLFDFGKAYLNTLCALVPFLERELIDTLPYMCCSLLPVFPPSLSQG